MRLYYCVVIDTDEAEALQARAPEHAAETCRDEIATALDSASGALGLARVIVQQLPDDVARFAMDENSRRERAAVTYRREK